MAEYNIGYFIKQKRIELGISQAELADGICSLATLSRIENGNNSPKQKHMSDLLQRLGCSDLQLLATMDDEQFKIVKTFFKMGDAFIIHDYETARQHLKSLELYHDRFTKPQRQQYELFEIMLSWDSDTPQNLMARLEKALKLTHPNYSVNSMPKVLTYEEISAMNMLACCYGKIGDYETATKILYHLKYHYDFVMSDTLEALSTQPMILYNLSKYLEKWGKYDESVAVSREGIVLAKRSGRCGALAKTQYNLAYVLVRRKQPGDLEEAHQAVREAYCMSKIVFRTEKTTKLIEKLLREYFDEEPPLV